MNARTRALGSAAPPVRATSVVVAVPAAYTTVIARSDVPDLRWPTQRHDVAEKHTKSLTSMSVAVLGGGGGAVWMATL